MTKDYDIYVSYSNIHDMEKVVIPIWLHWMDYYEYYGLRMAVLVMV